MVEKEFQGKDSAPPLRPGRARCLKCRNMFNSWDVARNRICPRCASGNDRAPAVYNTGLVESAESGSATEDT